MGRESHIDRASGKGVFARFPDCLISLSPTSACRTRNSGDETSRSQRSPSPFVIRMTPPVIAVAENADPTCYRRFGQPQPEQEINDESILDLISPGSSMPKEKWLAAARNAGATEEEFLFHYNQLRQSGKIKSSQSRRHNYLRKECRTMKSLLKKKEVAEKLGISIRSISRFEKAGFLPRIQISQGLFATTQRLLRN